MGINKYKESFYSKLFDFSNIDVVSWANNVYDKIKLNGILPRYLQREQSIKRVDITTFDPLSLVEDSNFVWGYRKKPLGIYGYILGETVDIGTVHTIEFELSDIGFSSGLLLSGSDSEIALYVSGINKIITYTIQGASISKIISIVDYNRIKINRNNNNISLFVNGALIDSQNLSTNTPFNFYRIALGTISVGEIKITRGDQNLHWWKLNSKNDDGLNDKDFYTFWYSICYLFAIINKYVKYLANLPYETLLLKKFLNSKAIEYSTNTSESDVIKLYTGWQDSINERGTFEIANPKQLVKGRCLLMKNILYGFSPKNESILLGTNYTVSFDWKYDISSAAVTGEIGALFYGINSNIAGKTNLVTFENSGGFIKLTFFGDQFINLAKTAEIRKISVRRLDDKYWVYVDGVLLVEEVTLTSIVIDNVDVFTSQILPTFIRGIIGRIGNLHIKLHSLYDMNVRMNAVSYVLDVDINQVSDSTYIKPDISYYGGVDAPVLTELFTNDDDFNNVKNRLVDGELLRLLNKDSTQEFILAMNSNIGWTLDTSSPMQRQTYPIVGFNKFYSKEKELTSIKNLPITFGGLDKTFFNTVIIDEVRSGVSGIKITPKISTTTSYGISAGSDIQTNFTYEKQPFIIPINENLAYEFSFRIKTTNPDINIKFRPLCYDINGNLLTPISAIGGGDIGSYFLNIELNDVGGYRGRFIQKINSCGEVWIRGILYESTKDPVVDVSRMNINIPFGRNLIMESNTKYVIPEILIESSTINVDPIYIWDVQVRPVISNVDKGNIDTKNLLSLYCVYDTGLDLTTLNETIKNKLIPYDNSLKIKRLYSDVNIYILTWDAGNSVIWDTEDLIEV